MKKNKLYRQLGIIIATLLVPVVPFAIIGELPGDQWLSANDANALRFALSGSALLAMDILLPLPSSVIGSLLAARLGLVPGFLATLAGLVAGHTVGWLLGRLALRSVAADLPETPTALIVFLSRPVPVLAEATAIAAGAGGMSLFRFLTVAVAGDSIYAAVLAANGVTLIPDGLFGLGLVVPMLLPVAGWLAWRYLIRPTP